MRERAYGQAYEPTVIDRFGVWLSARQIRRYTGSVAGKRVGDFGCGYHSTFMRTILTQVERAVLLDCDLAVVFTACPNVTAIEATLPQAFNQIASASLDLVLFISVLVHLCVLLAVL